MLYCAHPEPARALHLKICRDRCERNRLWNTAATAIVLPSAAEGPAFRQGTVLTAPKSNNEDRHPNTSERSDPAFSCTRFLGAGVA
jgi:hypothetical protein